MTQFVNKKPINKKQKPQVSHGIAFITATYNNTKIAIADLKGNILIWSTSGKLGFKGPRKSTPYAAGIVAKEIIEKAKEFGLRQVEVQVKGIGQGRESAIRTLNNMGISILSIKDVTSMPHNGPRPRKPRRV